MHTILGHFDLDNDFWTYFVVFVSGAYISYITANFPQNVSYARPIPLVAFVTLL